MRAKLGIGCIMSLAAVLPASAQLNPSFELHGCRNSPDPLEKIDHCSKVIATSRNRTALEVAFNSRGLTLMEQQRFLEAAGDFTAVIKLNPSIAGYYDNRQNAYRSAGQFQDALKDANRAIQLAPTYSFVYRGRGNFFNDMGQFSTALADYDRAIQISPGDGGLFIDRGKILEKLGRYQDAISGFSHALELDRKWTGAFRERGLAFKHEGHTEAALNDLSVFVQLQPDDQEAAQALAELRSRTTAATTPIQASAPPRPSPPPHLDEANPPQQQVENGQTTAIPMLREGGTFVVPVLINGQLTLKFTVDSGASDVSVPADVVSTLIRTETISDADFLGTQTYRLADGSTIPSQTFIIRSLKVGDRVLTNVQGSVAPAKGSLLLGQSFLSRFKSWSIDNQRQVLLLN
jgi:clan AA aspartic protease (TIGR02281 family)